MTVSSPDNPAPVPPSTPAGAPPSVVPAGDGFAALLANVAGAALLTHWHWTFLRRLTPDGLSGNDLLIFAWLVFGAFLLALLPVLFITGVLLRLRWRKLAVVAQGAGLALVAVVVHADRQVYEITGGHLTKFLPLLGVENAAAWGGGAGSIVTKVAVAALVCGAAAVGLMVVTRHAARLPGVRALRPRGRPEWAVVAAAYVGVAVAPFVAAPRFRSGAMLSDAAAAVGARNVILPGDDNVGPFATRVAELVRPDLARVGERLLAGPPGDDAFRLERAGGGPPPNVIFIVLDSLRADALDPATMPRLHAWAKGGATLRAHSATGNASHLGLFALLYGRPAPLYTPTLDARVPPQSSALLRRVGYRATYLSCGNVLGWMRMSEWVVPGFGFDEVHNDTEVAWNTGDANSLRRMTELATGSSAAGGASAGPQFVTCFLMSTHLPYPRPASFDRHLPVFDPDEDFFDAARDPARRAELVNGYRNAAGHLDELVWEAVRTLDPRRNVVVVTGDHGESLWDDGTYGHWNRQSDAETRVPCVIVGPGIPAGVVVDRPTTHADVLPTVLSAIAGKPVRPAGVSGQDVLDPAYAMDAVPLTIETYSASPLGFVLAADDGRLRFQVWPKRADVDTLGTVDVNGVLDQRTFPPVEDAEKWARRLAEQIKRMAG